MGRKRKEKNIITGTIALHQKGFGFVTRDDAEENELDIYISPEDTGGAMNGDRVGVDIIPQWLWDRNRPEGIVTKVIERNIREITGTFHYRKGGAVVESADRKHGMTIWIPKGETSGAAEGDKVVVKILSYPEPGRPAKGHVSSIIARKGERGADVRELIRAKGFLESFPSSAAAQAKAISRREIMEKELAGRRDLRNRKIFTMDGAYSKDFDDAVSIKKDADGNYVLGVHIADVTHYVEEDTPLDREALKRGNSVYVLDQVVPMLPVELSNGICSLNEGVDRLCLSVDMTVDRSGKVIAHEIYESVIRSCHRLVYDDVSDLLEKKDDALISRYEDIYEDLLSMEELYTILSGARKIRGSIDFDTPEPEIYLDERGKAEEITIAQRRTANRIIEEFMLLANETVAQHFYWIDMPFIYRVHEKPDVRKMAEFKMFLEGFSIRMKGDVSNVHPSVLSGILKEIQGSPYENVISTVMLRSMQKAYYSNECDGHYGLSLTYYTHFTSPIRRYADLFIHRVIKEQIHGRLDEAAMERYSIKASEAADQASKMERLAMEAEREGERLAKAEYMAGRVGETFDAVISGVIQSGFFVQLPNTIEGLVKLETLTDDFYEVDQARHRIIGVMGKKSYALGDAVRVKCIGASICDRTVDFVLYEKKKGKKRRKKR